MLRAQLLTAALVVAPLLSGCVGDEPTVAVLMADGSDSSSRVVDVDRLTDRVESTCDECRVRVYDAEGDAATQKSQARQAEAASADVLVVVPVDPDDLDTLTAGDLPVISFGELVPGSDRFVGLESGSRAISAAPISDESEPSPGRVSVTDSSGAGSARSARPASTSGPTSA